MNDISREQRRNNVVCERTTDRSRPQLPRNPSISILTSDDDALKADIDDDFRPAWQLEFDKSGDRLRARSPASFLSCFSSGDANNAHGADVPPFSMMEFSRKYVREQDPRSSGFFDACSATRSRRTDLGNLDRSQPTMPTLTLSSWSGRGGRKGGLRGSVAEAGRRRAAKRRQQEADAGADARNTGRKQEHALTGRKHAENAHGWRHDANIPRSRPQESSGLAKGGKVVFLDCDSFEGLRGFPLGVDCSIGVERPRHIVESWTVDSGQGWSASPDGSGVPGLVPSLPAMGSAPPSLSVSTPSRANGVEAGEEDYGQKQVPHSRSAARPSPICAALLITLGRHLADLLWRRSCQDLVTDPGFYKRVSESSRHPGSAQAVRPSASPRRAFDPWAVAITYTAYEALMMLTDYLVEVMIQRKQRRVVDSVAESLMPTTDNRTPARRPAPGHPDPENTPSLPKRCGLPPILACFSEPMSCS
ncbi:hypothetical protein CPLU01_00699 [Colletotrichum plurivorum]|uniref:Uncharacterized protein n=1 Tax=Colletotrichum plurivorum TaxID=2175906 RepID=A0A8H6U594_9PEZI|nr:hypothetical protein CPLU01_00699 [Colletotrichum plurivorum]